MTATQEAHGKCARCGARTTFTRHVDSPYEFDDICPVHGLQATVSWAHANTPPEFASAVQQPDLFAMKESQ